MQYGEFVKLNSRIATPKECCACGGVTMHRGCLRQFPNATIVTLQMRLP